MLNYAIGSIVDGADQKLTYLDFTLHIYACLLGDIMHLREIQLQSHGCHILI
uniref:Uncharacterized protein n=1 Tax=Tetranychus urticae TaxID=32264 RepID=T1L032_TETUR